MGNKKNIQLLAYVKSHMMDLQKDPKKGRSVFPLQIDKICSSLKERYLTARLILH